MWPNQQKTQDFVKPTEEILTEKLHFLCSDLYYPSFKLDIDCITFWDDPMLDGNVTIINILELFKQTSFLNNNKICAGSIDCRK